MSVPRVLLLSALLAVLCGCERYITTRGDFWKVVSTDYQGNVVSEWTAAGRVKRIEGGVEITAVEKKKPPTPFPYEARYVIGRRVKVIAPNISVFRTPPPAWMHGEVMLVEETEVTSFGK